MRTYHFTGQVTTAQGKTSREVTVTVSHLSAVLDAALEAGHQVRQTLAAEGFTGYLSIGRIESLPVVDAHAATREAGRKAGLTEAQIEAFIARQAA
jgi:hypothetical protein